MDQERILENVYLLVEEADMDEVVLDSIWVSGRSIYFFVSVCLATLQLRIEKLIPGTRQLVFPLACIFWRIERIYLILR